MTDTLAIHGGPKVRPHPMPPRLALGEAERAAVTEVLDYYRARGLDPGYQGHFEGLYTDAFVTSLGGGGFADAVSTGTVAVYLAIAALGLAKGSEVIVSPITDPGTLTAIIHNGLVPVLADCKPGSYNIGAPQVAERTSRRTSAVVVVHAAGQAAEIDAIVELARQRGLRVVEDCSQSHGALWQGRPVGTFGDIAAFSTMYRKAHISGGAGGMVYSPNEALHRLALAHADRGKPRWRSDFDDRDPSGYLFPALNHHTDEISSAIGLASLKRLGDTIRRRRAFVADLAALLEESSASCRACGASDADSPFFLPVSVDLGRITCSKIEFAEALGAEGIDLNPHYRYVVSEWPWVRPYLSDAFDCSNAVAVRDGSFNVYLNENYGRREAEDIVAAIRKVETHYAVV